MKFLFIAFIAVPIVELYVLISVGEVIGALTTVGLILLTAFIGAALVRAQGISTFNQVQMQLGRGEMPAMEIFEGLFLLVAGALLLTPGFVTDAIGFVCLTPPLRRAIIKRIIASDGFKARAHTVVQGASIRGGPSGEQSGKGAEQGRIIEGEYKDLNH